MKLKDKVALITGGSRGIGFATAKRFLEEGAKVIVATRRQETADKAVAQLKESEPGATVEGICPDLASLESVREAVKGIHDTDGRIYILVNNAGVSDSVPFTEYTEDLFDNVMNLTVKGVFNASRAVVDYMVEQII